MTVEQKDALNYQSLTPDTVKTDVLKTIDYAYQSRRGIDIVIRQPEFTAVGG